MAYTAPAGYQSEAAKKSRYDKGVATATAGGTAFQDYQNGSSDSDFLEKVYNNETGRGSDADGMSYWQGQLDSGVSRNDIISAFGNTQEGQGYDNPNQPPPEAQSMPAAGGIPVAGYAASTYNATRGSSTGYDAPDRAPVATYDANGQLITDADRSIATLNDMTASDSPYMQQARAQGIRQAQGRGLLNTTMAGEMSQGAAIAAAQPFALEDSNRSFTAGRDLTNATNRAAEFGAGATNQASLQTNQQQARASEFGAAAENAVERDYASAQNTASSQNMQAINKAASEYAHAKNTASIQEANNNLKMSLATMSDDLSRYGTDAARSTALDNIAAEMINSALSGGVFNDAATAQGFFQTVGSAIPALGIQVTAMAADQVSSDIIV